MCGELLLLVGVHGERNQTCRGSGLFVDGEIGDLIGDPGAFEQLAFVWLAWQVVLAWGACPGQRRHVIKPCPTLSVEDEQQMATRTALLLFSHIKEASQRHGTEY